MILAGLPFQWRKVRPVALLLTGAIVLVALQLVPLPPFIWTALPGRDLFVEAAAAMGQPQPWRPLSLSPGATWNALGSLIVPVAALALAANLDTQRHWRILAWLIVLVMAGAMLGMLQFSGARYDNPLTNDIRGLVSGSFANRNHFALFVAIGCLLIPAWAFHEDRNVRWKVLAATGVLAVMVLLLLAIGSRMGMVVGVLGLMLGAGAVQGSIRRASRQLPAKMIALLALSAAALVVLGVVLSISLDRAVSLDRALSLEASEDLRARFVPVTLDLAVRYFPAGSGFGAFDPVFRAGEPDDLLQITYANHAHNDWAELALDGGLLGILLGIAAIVWWLRASYRAWRNTASGNTLPRLGSAMILLVMVASLTDYPARTPMIMALLAIGAVWLNEGSLVRKSS